MVQQDHRDQRQLIKVRRVLKDREDHKVVQVLEVHKGQKPQQQPTKDRED